MFAALDECGGCLRRKEGIDWIDKSRGGVCNGKECTACKYLH